MGSRNRINLGEIAGIILHFHRNFYHRSRIYMSKRVHAKIREKHPEIKQYAELQMFQSLMQSTVASSLYDKCDDTINFIAYRDGKFVLYALKREKNHTSCNTIYILNTKTLRKLYKKEDFKLFKPEYREIVDEATAD